MQTRGPVPIGTGPLVFACGKQARTHHRRLASPDTTVKGSAASQGLPYVPVRLDELGLWWSREGAGWCQTQRSQVEAVTHAG